LADQLQIRAYYTIAVLLPLLPLLLIGAGALKAAEVTAESIIDQASALRDASSRVPAGARVLSSDCSDIALPGLSFRYRCSVRYDPATPRPVPARRRPPAALPEQRLPAAGPRAAGRGLPQRPPPAT